MWNNCSGTTAMESLPQSVKSSLWNRYEIIAVVTAGTLAVESLQRKDGCGIMAVKSLTWNTFVELLLWIH